MNIERRRFLQQTGLAFLTLGLSQMNLSRFNRYVQTLADPTKRKLALLIGINEYQDYAHLHGCLTDVELQKELLIHRFNFQPADVLTLTNAEATRENIENAFKQHLIQQAEENDVVIFHFSGYGSSAKIETAAATQPRIIPCLTPFDSNLQTKGLPTSNFLFEPNLDLLAQFLSTDKVVFVLDTSYLATDKSLQGNLRIRSLAKSPTEKSNLSEIALEENLQLQLSTQEKQGLKKRNNSALYLKAAKKDQWAAEKDWQGFSAGIFTYNLTQYLWEAIAPTSLMVSMSKTSANMASLVGTQQQPEIFTNSKTAKSIYYLPVTQAISAQGFISKINDTQIKLKLLGLPPNVIENYGVNSCVMIPQLQYKQYLQIRSFEGIECTAKLIDKNLKPTEVLEVGQLVQEYIRVLPHNLKLTVALDSCLERIERVDATSALLSLDTVTNVIKAGDQQADCVLGKTDEKYALFSSGGVFISKSRNKANEAIKPAITSLTPELKMILAAKLWRLTINQGSSLLPVEASLTLNKSTQPVTIKQSTRAGDPENITTKTKGQDLEFLTQITSGSQLDLEITNQGNKPIYFLILGILPNYQAIALYNSLLQKESLPWLIEAGQTRLVPNPAQNLTWKVPEVEGVTEIIFIFSEAEFSKTLDTLANNQQTIGDKEQLLQLGNPLEVSKAILKDLHAASAVSSDLVNTPEVYALDVNKWATLRFVYQVVAPTV